MAFMDVLPAGFEFRAATRLVVGAGSIARLGELANGLGATRALVVSDPGVVRMGHVAMGIESLRQAGLGVECFSDVGENPTTDHVNAGTAVARVFRPDVIVGIGGGSSMDCAKGINFLFSCGGRMQDYWGRGKATSPLLPAIAVPTTAGTGSETQSFALITAADSGVKMACGDTQAAFRVAILDVMLTLTQPARVAALTGIDAVSHAVESHVSLAATPASRIFSLEAFRLLAKYLPRVFESPADLEARSAVQLAAAWAGLGIENAMLGAAHSLANPLTVVHKLAHGQAVGLMLPHVVRFNATACEDRYAELLVHARGLPINHHTASSSLADFLTDLVAAAGLSTSFGGLKSGTDSTDCWTTNSVTSLAEAALLEWTAGFNPRPLALQDCIRLYEAAQ